MRKRILICGTSGIGKTTLAKLICERYKLPFINGSSTVLWDKYKIESHRDLLKMAIDEPQKGLDFQYELVDIRRRLTKDLEAFVTDRSLVDNIVYFLYQNAPFLTFEQTEKYIDYCHDTMSIIERKNCDLIYLTRNFHKNDPQPEISSDGKRIINTYFQDMVDGIFQQVVHGKPIRHTVMGEVAVSPYYNQHTIHYWNLETRMHRVEQIIRP